MKTTYKKGLFAEWLARQYLRLHGFRILESRYVTGRGTGRAEIDIIARRSDLILFIEVKNRPDALSGLKAISWTQSNRLRASAELYLRRIRHIGPARFDVMVVRGLRVQWFPNQV